MYRDNTLIPSEAIRLLALGLLAEGPRSYAQLAQGVREFLQLVVGPSLDLLAPPLELLKIEGLVGAEGVGSAAMLTLSPTGAEELQRLLAANLRAPTTDISKLILALKVRFLPLLPPAEQRLQAEMMAEVFQRARARLLELRERAPAGPAFGGWLAMELDKAERQLAWAQDLQRQLGGT